MHFVFLYLGKRKCVPISACQSAAIRRFYLMCSFSMLKHFWSSSPILSTWTRAPIVAMWADRFSQCCWQWFLRFLACPLTIPPVSASCYHLCSMPSLLPSYHRGKGEEVHETWVIKGRTEPLRLQQLDCHWGEVLIESRPRLLLLLRVMLLWVLMILVIAHWMHWSITYEIRLSQRFSRDWAIDRSPNPDLFILVLCE